MLKFSKVNMAVSIVVLLSLVLIWMKLPQIKIFPSSSNVVETDTNTAKWESGSGVKIDITILNKENWKSEYSKEWFSEIEPLLDTYTVAILEIALEPKVETLFIDIPANTNAKLTTKNGEILNTVNNEILEQYYEKDSSMKQYLETVYEETMSNNSPFTLNETKRLGILVFPKCINPEILELNVFNSEADIGSCKIIFK